MYPIVTNAERLPIPAYCAVNIPHQGPVFTAGRMQGLPGSDPGDAIPGVPVPTLQLNGKSINVEAPPDTALLRVLRASRMSRTKFGCGISLCGACIVHINVHDFRIPRINDVPQSR
jgi:hypothetical protein